MKKNKQGKYEMKQKKQRLLFRCVNAVVCLMLVWGVGCSSKRMWYKPDAGQRDFNIDDRECRIMAEEAARQVTLTGKTIDLEQFEKSYEACIYARGWSLTPVSAVNNVKNNHGKVRLSVKVKGNFITAFGRTMQVPKTFSLLQNRQTGFQGVNMQSLLFKGENAGENATYLNLAIQETRYRKFTSVDYPAIPPFFLFEKKVNPKDDARLRWTVFAGEFHGVWVAGIGAYYLLDNNKRFSFVITRQISFPKNKPPKGLRLTKVQKLEVESFKKQWIKQIKTAFGAF